MTAGVVVGVPTFVVNRGERLPTERLVMVPALPANVSIKVRSALIIGPQLGACSAGRVRPRFGVTVCAMAPLATNNNPIIKDFFI